MCMFSEALTEHFRNSPDFKVIFDNGIIVTVQGNGFNLEAITDLNNISEQHGFKMYEIYAASEKVKIKFKHKEYIPNG